MSERNVIAEDFDRLRTILSRPTAQKLDEVERRMEVVEQHVNGAPTAEGVSVVLPEAVRISGRKSQDLGTALTPMVESALDQSIARNKDKLGTALYPLLGTMIRKYVVEAVRDAMESFNMILARALSMEGVRWRWESWRTGIPVTRIAFKKSMVFRAEHVFLVHNKTGQPLLHLSAFDAMDVDKLAFAGMVGAITDFIKDAFLRREPIGLRSIGVGEFTVWFEEGPFATIAVVIRGEPEPFLRFRLRTISEQLHARYPVELKNAMVDEVSLLGYDAMLRGVLLQQPRRSREKLRRLGQIAVIAISAVMLTAAALGLNNYMRASARDTRFNDFISRVKTSDGILLTDYGKRPDGKYFVSGIVASPTAPAVLPVGDFGFRNDEVDVRLINHVFVVDQSNTNEPARNFQDQLDQLDGTPWPNDGSPEARTWLRNTTNRIANAYLMGQALGRPFILVIEHPRNLKASADKLSGQLGWRLHLQGVYDRHLIRTLPVDDGPGVLRVLQERTVGE
jgi:hypothetical protein